MNDSVAAAEEARKKIKNNKIHKDKFGGSPRKLKGEPRGKWVRVGEGRWKWVPRDCSR